MTDDFLAINPSDEGLGKVGCVVCEPPSTSNAVVDQLEYLLLNNEYPFANYVKADVELLSMYSYSHIIRALDSECHNRLFCGC